MTFIPGQRWVSQAEPKLGLGVIIKNLDQLVEVIFPAADEQRTYRADAAPLSRIIYRPGEVIRNIDGEQLTIRNSTEHNGNIVYLVDSETEKDILLPEIQLAADIQLSSPLDKLSAGQLSKPKDYALRRQLIHAQHGAETLNCRGLLGGRIALLEHQIYIAAEVGQRLSPRVLLADEVGLGKTIEAALILHQQLLTQRAQRVLICVPNSLVHQWLVELLRKVNIFCAIFDESRCASLPDDENPFESEQIVLCDLEWLANNATRRQQAASANFDILLIDEAHNLHWSPTYQCPAYSAVEELSQSIPGLLLLTATPEQAGLESHFARLRLLDPKRFHSFIEYQKETQEYQALSSLIERLEESKSINHDLQQAMESYLSTNEIEDIVSSSDCVEAAINALIDRHGTGRIMFRNSRHRISGFPKRHINPVPLESIYQGRFNLNGLFPERHADDLWVEQDTRVHWLCDFLQQHKKEKVLLICAHKDTAQILEQYLRLNRGISAADFHEELSIIERDRAAAYFADPDSGAQILICSEIGSEGRNFQFAKHLVLFDLPLNPDTLEQRIGRIDRIGQGADIFIHIPYLLDSAQHHLFQWYQNGLKLFNAPFAGAHSIYEAHHHALTEYLCNADIDDTWLTDIASKSDQLRYELDQGRDRLLERNSCRSDIAQQWIANIQQAEQNANLAELFDKVLDAYGVESEQHTATSLVLQLGEQRLANPFPMLGDEGLTITFDRATALSHEDIHFLTWEHPIVSEAVDGIINSENANCSIGTVAIKGIAAGSMLVECQYQLNCIAPSKLQIARYFEQALPRVLLMHDGRDLSTLIPAHALDNLVQGLPKNTAIKVANQQRSLIETIAKKGQKIIDADLQSMIKNAQQKLNDKLKLEIDRLVALQRKNPLVRSDEIDTMSAFLNEGLTALSNSKADLIGIRIIVAT
jgi:ATP-dependent helicase HepA